MDKKVIFGFNSGVDGVDNIITVYDNSTYVAEGICHDKYLYSLFKVEGSKLFYKHIYSNYEKEYIDRMKWSVSYRSKAFTEPFLKLYNEWMNNEADKVLLDSYNRLE